MSFKILHISDVHVRRLRYHSEYREVFSQLYEKAKELKPDIIVNTGDTVHAKLSLSPESVQLVSELFSNLADIAPFHIILGNHDMNLRSVGRLDAISPIVNNLNHPNIHFHKYSNVISLNEDIELHVLSIVDEDNWVTDTNDEKINIALYHGSICGVTTDTGWVMEHGDLDINKLSNMDYVLLGDIHKTHQKVDKEGRIAYPGSLVTQNFGETNDKGFLLWDIESKSKFSCEHFQLENPKPFITVSLTPKGKMPKGFNAPLGARLRLISENNLPLDVMRKALDVAKRRFKPESITFLNRSAGEPGNVRDDGNLETKDLRDIKIQEELMKEYLKDYEVENGLMKKIIELNLKYNKLAEENEDISRNIKWRLRSLEFDNLFNYGKNNKVDFDNLNGVVGILGKNFSGKSSIINSLQYVLFNSISKGNRKNLNIINQNKNSCFGRVKISVGDLDYTIERTSEKYTKKLKGAETKEAKTNVEFSVHSEITGETLNLNGTTRNETDRNIRRVFGTLEDFLYSSMASQHGSLSFIQEGSTKRKEILAKFLDLKFFETKFKLAKEDAAMTRGAFKKLENREFEEEIGQAKEDLKSSEEQLKEHKNNCTVLKNNIEMHNEEIRKIQEQISSIPAEIIDIVSARGDLVDKKYQLLSTRESIKSLEENRDKDKKEYTQICAFVGAFDEETLYEKSGEIEELKKNIANYNSVLDREAMELEANEKRVKILEGIPCNTEYPSCKFIKNAYASKAIVPENKKEIIKIEGQIEDTSHKIRELNPKLVSTQIEKYQEIVDKRNKLSGNVVNYNLKIDKSNSSVKNILNDIEKLEQRISEYEENKEAIENLEGLNKKLTSAKFNKQRKEVVHEECNSNILNFYKTIGSSEEKIKNLEEQMQTHEDIREEYSAYDLYLRCMHPNGIAFDVIRKRLPIINEEIAKVLANIVDFEIFFEDDGKRLDIFIRHPKYDSRPLEMGSGAEKTIAAMAIRLALLSVTSLPVSSVFIMDEPGTSLDEDNMQGFIDVLSIVKSYFRTVLLISHLDSLKDCVDSQITIDKINDYAFVSV